jgi:hypothetical protein
MTINYVYNDKGVAEYVVIPTTIWEQLQKYLSINKIKNAVDLSKKKDDKKFNPREYKGILSSINIDIEQELKNMRNEWKRDF